MPEIGELFVKIGAKTQDLEKGLSDVDKAMKQMGQNFQQIGGQLQAAGKTMAIAGAAMLAPIVGSVAAFAKFDGAMTESTAIMGDLSDAMHKDLVNAAKDVATITTFSASEAAKAYFYLASAGLDAATSIKSLPVVAKFAQAGMFDMALATDLLTDAQSALGLTIRNDAVKNMENMVRVGDVLVKANILANATVQQFSESLTNRAGPALRMVGKDVEEGVAVLAAFADQGIKGAEAGTRLDIVLRDLQTRAIKNAEAFKKYSVTVFDSNGEMRNMADIIADLERALEGQSDERKRSILMEMEFQDRSVASIMTLLGMSDAVRNYETNLRNAGGTMEEISRKQLETMSAQFKLLKNQTEVIAITLGATLEPMIKKLTDTAGKFAEKLKTWVEENPKLASTLLHVGAALGSLLVVGGTATIMLGTLIKSIGTLITTLPLLKGHLSGVSLALGKVSAIGAAAFVGWKIGEKISEVTGLGNAISNFLVKPLKELPQATMDNNTAMFKLKTTYGLTRTELEILNQKFGDYKTAFEAINDKQETGIKKIDEYKTSTEKLVVEIEKENQLLVITAEAEEEVAKKAEELKKKNEELKNTVISLQNALAGVNEEMWSSVDTGIELGGTLKDVVGGGLAKVIGDAQELGTETMPAIKTEFEEFGKTAEKVTKDVQKAWKDALSTIGSLFQVLADEISGNFGNLVSYIGLAFDQIGSAADKSAKAILEAIGPVLAGKIGGAFGQMVSSAKKSFAAIGSALGSAIGSIIPGIGTIVGSAIGGLIGGLFKQVDKAAESAKRQLEAWNKAISHTQVLLGNLGKISKETSEEINEMAKSMQGYIAVDKLFAQIIKDVGVNQENVNTLWERAINIIEHYSAGQLSAADASGVLNDAFELLLQGARDLGQEGSQAMLDFILAAREMGLEIPSMSRYIMSELDKIPNALSVMINNIRKLEFIDQSVIDKVRKRVREVTVLIGEQQIEILEKYAKNIPKIKQLLGEELTGVFEKWMDLNDKGWGNILEWVDEYNLKIADLVPKIEKQLNNMAVVVNTTFQAMMAEGRGYYESIMALQEPLQMLSERYAALGIDVPEFMKPLIELSDKIMLKPAVFQNIDAAITILKAMSNTGYMTQDAFNALADTAKKLARVIIGDLGMSITKFMADTTEATKLSSAQMEQLLPTIAQFIGTAAMFGLGIPSWMRSFVVNKLGLDWQDFKRTVTAQANAGIATVEKLGAVQHVLASLERTNTRVMERMGDNIVDWLREIHRGLGKIGKFQHGGIAMKPQLAMVAEREPELIIPLSQLRAGKMPEAVSGAGNITNSFTFYISALDGADVEAVIKNRVMPILDRAYRDNIGGSTRNLADQMRKYR